LQENRHAFFGEKLVTTRQQREGRALLRRRQRRAGRRPSRAARSVGIGQRQQVRLCAATRERVELHLNFLYRSIEYDLALKFAAIPFEVFRFFDVDVDDVGFERLNPHTRRPGFRIGNQRDRLRRDDLRGKPSQRPPPPKGSPRFQRRVLEPPCREPIPRPLARAAQFRGAREPRPHDVGEMAQRRHHFGTIEAFVANAGDGVGAKRDGGRGSQFLLGPLLRGRRLRVSHAGDRKPKQHNRPAGNGGLHFPSLSGAATRRNRKNGDAETGRATRKTAQPAWSG